MATIVMQRDLVVVLKREAISNVGILSKLHTMPTELSRLVFKENALEKPTQNLFNHLSYYLVSIVDPNACGLFTWPLYDTKAERAFRNELAAFISDYSSKGLLSPIMSSYLVNPGCYKVTVLIFQLSQLAVNRMLVTKMVKDSQKELYNDMTNKFTSQHEDGFIESIEKETQVMLSKFSNYLLKRKVMERIAELFRRKITEMETKLSSMNAQSYINNLVDGYLDKHSLDEETKSEVLKIKNIHEQSNFFDMWLTHTDTTIDGIESGWSSKTTLLMDLGQSMYESTRSLIARSTGESDRSTYTIEYNPLTDAICTKDLETHVNSQQKYVLRNIEKDGRLNFPNLVRAFLISICYILKQNEIGDEIYRFNEYLDGGCRGYGELASAMRILIERMLTAEAKLQPAIVPYNQSISMREICEIPPLPDLSDLKMNKDTLSQTFFDTFTPLNLTKHQFNLHRRSSRPIFAKPQTRSLITPFHQVPRHDFLKTVTSCRVNSFDRPNPIEEGHNLSIISHINRANETIAECSAGFTKQQILRLLSTKKSSSSKKFQYKTERPNNNVVKGGLFNESNASSENNVLFRSYSSPNLFENREKRCYSKGRGRKLSIMQENIPSLLEVSGIAAFEQDNYSTPQGFGNAESSRNVIDTSSLPPISVPSEAERKINSVLNNMAIDLNKEMGIDGIISPILEEPRKSVEHSEPAKNDTPKMNTNLIRKTSSLEKIINRFKKVRANVLPEKREIDNAECKTIIEEKENIKTVNFEMFTANRILLPDLLSPSCNNIPKKSNMNTSYLDQICSRMDEAVSTKPRQSLGTALGVDQTFLDQFDLLD